MIHNPENEIRNHSNDRSRSSSECTEDNIDSGADSEEALLLLSKNESLPRSPQANDKLVISSEAYASSDINSTEPSSTSLFTSGSSPFTAIETTQSQQVVQNSPLYSSNDQVSSLVGSRDNTTPTSPRRPATLIDSAIDFLYEVRGPTSSASHDARYVEGDENSQVDPGLINPLFPSSISAFNSEEYLSDTVLSSEINRSIDDHIATNNTHTLSNSSPRDNAQDSLNTIRDSTVSTDQSSLDEDDKDQSTSWTTTSEMA